MEYALIFILQLLGIGFHVGEKVLELDKLSPDDSLGDVLKLFWKSDKITLFISGLIIGLNEVGHYIVHVYAPKSVTEWQYFDLVMFALALVLGYAGQRLVYGALGKAVVFAEKKVNDKLS